MLAKRSEWYLWRMIEQQRVLRNTKEDIVVSNKKSVVS